MTPAGERILLTGANGHLAQRLIRHCATQEGAPSVRAMVRSQRAASVLEALPKTLRPEVVVVDYAQPRQLRVAMEGCARVIHLAGILKETRANRYRDAHERPARALVEAADEVGLARLIHISILGADPSAANACLASRGRADEILLGGKTPALILRVPMVLGPGDAAAEALRRQATAGTVRLVGGGATLEQPIAARDVVAALLPGTPRHPLPDVLDLAGPESLSHHALVSRAARILGIRVRIKSVPSFAALGAAHLAALLLSNPPITPAMLGVLEHDDAVDPEPARAALGIELTPLDEMLRLALEPGVETRGERP